jgi:hypothetical protein
LVCSAILFSSGVTVELGLKSAADAARLVLKAGKRPSAAETSEDAALPYSSKSPSELDIDNRARNALLRDLRCRGEREFAVHADLAATIEHALQPEHLSLWTGKA